MEEFDLLLQQGNLGFYTSCEVTSAVIFDKETKKAYNYYTIFVFEERGVRIKEPRYLTKKPILLSKRFSLCVMQYQTLLEAARENYQKLIKASNCCDLGCGELYLGKLRKIPKQFIPRDSTKEILMNKGLKNNFKNGSYILEFFDMQKPLEALLTRKELQLAAQRLYKIIPIDLFVLSDRVGNVIFQFPSQIIYFVFKTDEEERILDFHFNIDSRIQNPERYLVTASAEFDDTVVGFGVNTGAEQAAFSLNSGDTAALNQIQVLDKETHLIVSLAFTSFIRHMKMNMHIGSRFGNKRSIIDRNGQVILLSIDSQESFGVPRKVQGQWKDYTRKRQYQMSLHELEKQMKFMQYGCCPGKNEREKAMHDIRKLIEKFEDKKIFLWDPYLSAEDILDTLYYTRHYNTELRAITAGILKKRKNIDETDYTSVQDWIQQQKQIFETRSNNYGLKLEVRCQYGNYGFPFHDRFLIFISAEDTARVWSLGASVNSLGRAHHIVQEVNHPQHIVDAFEQLWKLLEDSACLVWNSRQPAKGRI